jgi:peptide/nickel transport system substrate-binding protein
MTLLRRDLLAIPAIAAASSLSTGARAQGGGGGILRIVVGTNLRNLDVAKTTLGEEYIYDLLVFNGLTRLKEDLTLEPELAESWTYSEDLKVWTFKLRPGVKFHNGREMVADDVVATFRRILDPATASAARSGYDMIEAMEAQGKYTVVFRLSYAYGGFADILADRQAKIVPPEGFDTLATHPIGTGPFVFRSYTPGDRLILARNPDYYESGKPKLDGVELRIIPEMAVRVAALQAGDIDIVWDIAPEAVRTLRENSSLRVESIPTPTWDAAVLNCAAPPFDDQRVRLALHLAVPKKDMVEAVLFGEGAPTHSPIPPTHPFFAKDVPIPDQADVAQARRLLAAAGHARGLRVPLIVPVGRPVRERLGVTMQQLGRPAGFQFEIQRVPFSRYSAEVSGKAPISVNGFFARPTVDSGMFPFLHSQGSWNPRLWNYSEPRVDAALTAARLTGDVETQKGHYQTVQRVLAENPASYFAYTANFACAYRSKVQNVSTHPMRWFDLRETVVAA